MLFFSEPTLDTVDLPQEPGFMPTVHGRVHFPPSGLVLILPELAPELFNRIIDLSDLVLLDRMNLTDKRSYDRMASPERVPCVNFIVVHLRIVRLKTADDAIGGAIFGPFKAHSIGKESIFDNIRFGDPAKIFAKEIAVPDTHHGAVRLPSTDVRIPAECHDFLWNDFARVHLTQRHGAIPIFPGILEIPDG